MSLGFDAPSVLDSGGPWFDAIHGIDAIHALGFAPGGFWATSDSGKSWRQIFGSSAAWPVPWQNDTWSAIVATNGSSMHNLGDCQAAGPAAVNTSSVCAAAAARWFVDAAGTWRAEIVPRPVCFRGVPAAGVRSPLFRTTGGAQLRLSDGSVLTTVILQLDPHGADGRRTSIVAFRSDADGYDFTFAGVVATPASVPASHEGPNENDLSLQSDGTTVLCVFRLDAGDRGGFLPYARSTSSDGGSTWSKPVLLGAGIGSARPRLLSLAGGALLLSGGRPRYNSRDVIVWLDAAGDGRAWREYSISYQHNRLVSNASRRFPDSLNGSSGWPRPCTSYTSLVRTGPSSAFVVYGLSTKGGFGGAFSMPFRLQYGV